MSQITLQLEIEDFEREQKGISKMSAERYGFAPLDDSLLFEIYFESVNRKLIQGEYAR